MPIREPGTTAPQPIRAELANVQKIRTLPTATATCKVQRSLPVQTERFERHHFPWGWKLRHSSWQVFR